MPLQNRVDPFGNIVADPHRGSFTGNRGIIHNDQQQIVKPFTLKAWITCTLHYKNFRRQVMTGRKWTELFFLDEVTAFAAGHRPCAFCRHPDFKRFKQLWLQVNPEYFHGRETVPMTEIDKILHAERFGPGKEKFRVDMRLADLPNGTCFTLKGRTETDSPLVKYNGMIKAWSFAGYQQPVLIGPNKIVSVLTPASILRTFSAGYLPAISNSFFAT